MSIELVMPSNHFNLCYHLLFLPSVLPSISLFQWVYSVHHVAKVLELQFSINPYSERSGLISFRIDWFDLLAVQGTLKSLLQHHSSKASILQRSAFFMVQLSHSYMTTGKTLALSRQTFVGKVMSLLFNILSRFVITLLPSSKVLLISWLPSMFTVILEPKKIKFVTVSTFLLSICHESDGTRCYNLSFWMLNFKPVSFYFLISLSTKGCLVLLHFLPLEWYHLHI